LSHETSDNLTRCLKAVRETSKVVPRWGSIEPTASGKISHDLLILFQSCYGG
jgi:hypothetical protein